MLKRSEAAGARCSRWFSRIKNDVDADVQCPMIKNDESWWPNDFLVVLTWRSVSPSQAINCLLDLRRPDSLRTRGLLRTSWWEDKTCPPPIFLDISGEDGDPGGGGGDHHGIGDWEGGEGEGGKDKYKIPCIFSEMKMEKLILISFMKVGKEEVLEEEDEIKEKVKVGKTNTKLLVSFLRWRWRRCLCCRWPI